MNIPRSSLRTGRYCKFTSNYEGIAVIELCSFTTFLTVTDCVLALSQTKE